jgi:SPP1 gp7 family putative phage head morphogenesis protein
VGLNRAVDLLYKQNTITLAKKSPDFDNSKFDDAIRFLHQNNGIVPDDLAKQAPRQLLNEINKCLAASIAKGIRNAKLKYEVPEEMLYALRENVFVFSGMKTYHQLKEASQLLTTDTGEVKPFYRFKEDVQKINAAYNQRYLETEYGFALHSAQMAVKWNDYLQDGDDYNLQYRTAGDDKVRADHDALNGTTLPMGDAFWSKYVPPLDWGCRCTIIQVIKDKYPESNSARAQELGNAATTRISADGTNKLSMFRYNPGHALKIFPQKHPYFPRGCDNCRHNLQLKANIPDNELCRVCLISKKLAQKSAAAIERQKYLAEMEHLLKKEVVKQADGKSIVVKFNAKGNKHLYNDTLGRTKTLNKNDLKLLDKELKNSTFVKSAGLSHERKDNIKKFYYFKDKEKNLYYNVAERRRKREDGSEEIYRFLYSVTSIIK